MDDRARRISTRSVARLVRHGRRWCGGAYRLVFVALSLNVNVVKSGRDASVSRHRHADSHDRHLRHLRLRAHGRPRPPGCGHRMARCRSHLDRRIPTRVRPGRPSRRKQCLASQKASDRCCCALPHPTGRRSVPRRRPNRRAVCRRGSDGRRDDAHDLGRWLLLVGVPVREPEPFDRSP